MKTLKLGQPAKDVVTGFEGHIMGYAKYFTGCDQYLLQPTAKDDSKYPEAVWFDEGRIIVLPTEEIKEETVKGEKPGCDYSAPIK